MENYIVNINDFPKRGSFIKWKECVGIDVDIVYKNHLYTVEIIDTIYKDKNKSYDIVFKYKEKNYTMRDSCFRRCQFKNVFNFNKMTECIPELYVVDYEKNLSLLGYNHEFIESLSYNTDVKLYFVCVQCGKSVQTPITPRRLINRNMSIRGCFWCGDGVSYPEKLFYNMLDCLNIKGVKTSFHWSNKKIYDCYIESMNTIIELHGIQHYKENSNFSMSLQNQTDNDKFKKEMALKNGIDKYIEINCGMSDLKYIKHNIINSDLSKLIDMSNVDWAYCDMEANKSLMVEVCTCWNGIRDEDKNIKIMCDKYNLSDTSVRRYLKKGHSQGLCKYDSKILLKNRKVPVRKNSYLCSIKEEEIEFFTHQEICEYYNISRSIVHNIIKKSKEYKPYSKQHYDRYKHIIGLKIIAKY